MTIQEVNTLPMANWYGIDEFNEPTNPENRNPIDVFTFYLPNSSHQNLPQLSVVPWPPESCPDSYFLNASENYECMIDENPRKDITDQIKGYLFLEPGWDGYEGIPPSKEVVNDAITMVKALPEGFPLPKPMVAGDGEVGLYWKRGNAFIDIEFSGNGLITYYARAADGREFYGEDIEFSFNEVPSGIIETLGNFV
jgi:hypothetical protein